MGLVRRSELPRTNIDGLNRMVLDDLLVEFGTTDLTEAEIDHFNHAWHRLTPWPDVVLGLARSRQRLVVATLSNGNVALLTNMADNSGLHPLVRAANVLQAGTGDLRDGGGISWPHDRRNDNSGGPYP